jgi:uncharacterized protein YdaU (DUF1376 family)
MSGADTWMPLYVGDYLADTAHLTQTQHGAYLLLLMSLWRQNGQFADDDNTLATVTHSTPQEWKRLRPVLARFCTVADGIWTQKRLTIEIEKAGRRYKSKIENGRLGGLRRGRIATTGSAARDRPISDCLATTSDSDGRPLSDRGVQPQSQPQPQVELLSVDTGGRAVDGKRRGRS